MRVKQIRVAVSDMVKGYRDSGENGVVTYGGRLDVRPPYQREFVYDDKQQQEVVNSVMAGFPLGEIHWARVHGGRYEIVDGQQRTLSLCKFFGGEFSMRAGSGSGLDGVRYFSGLPDDMQRRFLDYRLRVYVCDGTDSEKLDWYKIINIRGESLTDQELRNALYTGPWLADAKRRFSRQGCAAQGLSEGYVHAAVNRQGLLEIALAWAAGGKKYIEEYMAGFQDEPDAEELWSVFEDTVEWAKEMFPRRRKQMVSVDWQALYDVHSTRQDLDPDVLEEEITQLLQDDDVTKKAGIYPYVLDRNESHLSIRLFTPKMKTEAYERQKGVCVVCSKKFRIDEMEGDHIDPWHEGGPTSADNLQMLCRKCNRRKGAR